MKFIFKFIWAVSFLVAGCSQIINTMERPPSKSERERWIQQEWEKLEQRRSAVQERKIKQAQARERFMQHALEQLEQQKLQKQRQANIPPAIIPAQSNIKVEISNQSENVVGIFMDWPAAPEGCMIAWIVAGGQDMPGLEVTNKGRVFIATNVGIYQMSPDQEKRNLVLVKLESSRQNAPGEVYKQTIQTRVKSIPYSDLRDIIIIVNPDGSVTFSKRNP